MPGGHPPKYKTPKDLQAGVDKYLNECEAAEHHATVLGLTVALGFCDYQSLTDQCKRGPLFSCIIKRAKMKMWDTKLQAASKGTLNPTIFIFDSINNHGMVNTRSDNKNDNKNTGSVTFVMSKDDENL